MPHRYNEGSGLAVYLCGRRAAAMEADNWCKLETIEEHRRQNLCYKPHAVAPCRLDGSAVLFVDE
jgi:hypothetical protein